MTPKTSRKQRRQQQQNQNQTAFKANNITETKTATLGSISPPAHELPQKCTYPISSGSLPTSHKAEIQQNGPTY